MNHWELHKHDMIIENLTKEEIEEIGRRLKGMTYIVRLVDSNE